MVWFVFKWLDFCKQLMTLGSYFSFRTYELVFFLYLNPFWVTCRKLTPFHFVLFWLARRPTQSIGMLSYTFLRSTGKEDIIVPMVTSIPSWFSCILILWIPSMLNNHCTGCLLSIMYIFDILELFYYYFLWRIICWTFCLLSQKVVR